MFKTRLKTGVWLFIAVCVALLFSDHPLIMSLIVGFLCVFSAWEMSIALKFQKGLIPVVLCLGELTILMGMPEAIYKVLLGILFVGMVGFFGVLMHHLGKVEDLKKSEKVFIMASIPVFFSAIKYIRDLPQGLMILAVAILVCMITDSFAYLVGRQFGRHKMAPRISPSKTVEGSIGGTLAAAAVLLLGAYWISVTRNVEISYGRLFVYLVTASFMGQFGDLCMSSVKRIARLKDYGDLLPGHGGILDRFDSQLFVLPYTYLFCAVCGRIF